MRRQQRKEVFEMRSNGYATKTAMVKIGTSLVSLLVGTVLALSTGPAMASGEHKVIDEKAKVEMNKVEKNKVDKEMLKEKRVDEEKVKLDLEELLGEDILGEVLGERILGIEEEE